MRIPHNSKVLIFCACWFWIANTGTSAGAQEIGCNGLDALSCVSSAECMLTAKSECIAPWDRCQIGFQQAILGSAGNSIDYEQHQSTVDQCHSQAGCSYIPAEQCYCPPDVSCVCGGGEPPNCLPTESGMLSPPVGEFVIVDARAVSGVATSPVLQDVGEIIGNTVSLSAEAISLEAIACDEWEIREIPVPLDVMDPLLADVMLGPVELGDTVVDHRVLTGWNYGCEGESLIDILEIDGRVLVAPWMNGAVNLILERPLTSGEIHLAQTNLKNQKFLDQVSTGQLDEATIAAFGFWAEYRNQETQAYRFARTAITENLLVGLIGPD
jgi:hypothetical protein